MAGVVRRGLMGFGLLALASSMVALLPTPAASQQARFNTASLTYLTGQSVVPVFHGWSENADGTFDLHFSYLNRNWQEEVNIPVGPDNNIQPAPFGPDGGQPTHFYPRMNRWQFTVRVPADFGKKEIVWALTSHGETIRTYASLDPGYAIDDYLMQFENGGNHIRGRKKPELAIDGARERSVKVGEASPLSIVATDPAPPPPPRASGNADEGVEAQHGVVAPRTPGGETPLLVTVVLPKVAGLAKWDPESLAARSFDQPLVACGWLCSSIVVPASSSSIPRCGSRSGRISVEAPRGRLDGSRRRSRPATSGCTT
jgi:hypothetical protein